MISPGDLGETQQKLFRTTVFLGKLLLLGLVFRGILYLYPDTTPLQILLAELVTGGLRLMGLEAVAESTMIFTGETAFLISQDCLGWKSLAAFTGLVLATPGKKARVLLAGAVLIIVANFVRILTTVYLTQTGLVTFELLHGLLWTWGLTAVVLVAWGLWFSGNLPDSEHLNKRIRNL